MTMRVCVDWVVGYSSSDMQCDRQWKKYWSNKI